MFCIYYNLKLNIYQTVKISLNCICQELSKFIAGRIFIKNGFLWVFIEKIIRYILAI